MENMTNMYHLLLLYTLAHLALNFLTENVMNIRDVLIHITHINKAPSIYQSLF